MSLREALNKVAANRNREELEHSALPGEKLWLQEISGAERDEWEKVMSKQTAKDGSFNDFGAIRAKLIQLALVDEAGAQVYAADELAEINKLPGTLREDLFEAASAFNGLSKQAEEAQLKNSDSEAGNGSSAASQSNSDSPTFGNYLNP